MKKYLCSLFVFGLIFSGSLKANDGYAAKGAGGIVFKKSSYISMESEVLTISKNKVNVKYEFINRRGLAEKKDAEEALIAFPMPKISCGYWGKPKIPEDFTVFVDGKLVKYDREVKAFQGDKDVTKKVLAAGLPTDCREVYDNKEIFKKAQKKGWADDYKGEDPEDVKFITQITYYWKQKFPSNKTVKIEHSYTPVLGVDIGSPTWFFNLAPHWDRNPNIRWEKLKDSSLDFHRSDVNGGNSLHYILVTAKTWKMNAVNRFKLVLKKDNEKSFIGSTLGPLKKIDNNTYEYRASNFSPDRNLSIFFGK